MIYQEERFTEFESEALPLFELHYKEVAHFQDIPLSPNLELYRHMCASGILKCFTARDEGKIVGYAIFFVKENLHYQTSVQAVNDVIFIEKSKRGLGGSFIDWCDKMLAAMGVQAVYHHVKAEHNWGPMIERKGYKLVDLIYVKRLDGEV